MFDSANHCVELDFIRSVVALLAGEGPREKSHWVLEAFIVKALCEDCSHSDTTAISLENEGTIEVR